MIGAALEQKVWVKTAGGLIFPNMYICLCGNPGIGKTRSILESLEFYRDIPQPYLGATSMSRASMVDLLSEYKRQIPRLPGPMLEYHCMYIAADELAAFMPKYDEDMVGALTQFYEVKPYSEAKRSASIRKNFENAQVNLIFGSTPSNLLGTLKEAAWNQGFCSRLVLVWAVDRPRINIWDEKRKALEKPKDMIHDFMLVNSVHGQFSWDGAWGKLMHDWKMENFRPEPTHPKLQHYCARREVQVIKLGMISAIDRDNRLHLTAEDFHRAKGWLLDAEKGMHHVFEQGSFSYDGHIMDETVHFMKSFDGPVPERKIVNFARQHLSLQALGGFIENMERSGLIKRDSYDPKTAISTWIICE